MPLQRAACLPLKQVIQEKETEATMPFMCFFDLPSKMTYQASLVMQWLRIPLPMQGTQVRSLVREYPTCRGATKPMGHNY